MGYKRAKETMKKNILIASILGLFLFGSATTIIINAQEFERRECVEGYRFYATMWCSIDGNTYHFDVYEATNMCNAYRGIGGFKGTSRPTCYDVKKENNDFYVYSGGYWRKIFR